MRRRLKGVGLLVSLMTAIAVAGLTAAPASADENGCPTSSSLGNRLASNRVGATATVNGNDVSYTFESFVTEGSGGVPGLIEYCVYSATQPDSVNVVAVGDNGGAWTDPPNFDNFSYQRPDGDPSNIPYDGGSHTMGTATWNSGVPSGFDTIVLHINDAAECDALYGGNPGTCFVLPGAKPRVPAVTGALPKSYWLSTPGQNIIKRGASTGGVCNSGTWLRQFAPFQDLSVTASCSTVANYVKSVIAAAKPNAATGNPMLKAQMLATALDVYFSDAALGGNKIGAPAPLGGVVIDLTLICKMTDLVGGSATCSGIYQDASPVFGGASSLTVNDMLSYAASQSNVGGSTWYGNVRADQDLAKDAFDAVNNQVAFSP